MLLSARLMQDLDASPAGCVAADPPVPARPATSAAGSCTRCSRPRRARPLPAAPAGGARRRGAPASRSSAGDVARRRQPLRARARRASTSPTTWSTRWARPDSFEQLDRRGGDDLRRGGRATRACGGSSTSAASASGADLSPHLASRQEVGRLLAATGVADDRVPRLDRDRLRQPLLRDAPRAGRAAARDDHAALGADPRAADRDRGRARLPRSPRSTSTRDGSEVFEIGGADVASLRRADARVRAPARPAPAARPVPVLTPRLSSLWLGLVTPVYARVGRKLIESLRTRRSCATAARSSASRSGRAATARRSRARSANEDREFAETRWSDALSVGERAARSVGEQPRGSRSSTPGRARGAGRRRRRRSRRSARIGGATGWYYGNALWRAARLRSTCSRAASACAAAAATRRRRSSATRSTSGASRPSSRTACCACAPRCGCPAAPGSSSRSTATSTARRIRQTAIFDPVGLAGPALLVRPLPVHGLVFAGMLAGSPGRRHRQRQASYDRSRSRSDDAHRGRPLHPRPTCPRPPRAGGGQARLRSGRAALRPRRAARSRRARSATAS